MKILKACIGKELQITNGIKPTRMYPLKINVDDINKTELEKLVNENSLEIYQYELTVAPSRKYRGDLKIDVEIISQKCKAK